MTKVTCNIVTATFDFVRLEFDWNKSFRLYLSSLMHLFQLELCTNVTMRYSRQWFKTFTNALVHFHHGLLRADAYVTLNWYSQPRFKISHFYFSPVDCTYVFVHSDVENCKKCISELATRPIFWRHSTLATSAKNELLVWMWPMIVW